MSFVDQDTQVTIHAELNESVISGTHRNQHLIPAFLEVIRETVEYVQLSAKIPAYALEDDEAEFWDSDDSHHLREELFDLLDSFSPEGYSFGSHIGDGSDFAYWEDEGEEESDFGVWTYEEEEIDIDSLNTGTITALYGASHHATECYWYEVGGAYWYVADGGKLVNCTSTPLIDGVDLEQLLDHDSFNWNEPIKSVEQLVRAVQD